MTVITAEQARRMMSNELPMWTVYDHPLDYPSGYIARKWIVAPDHSEPIRTNEVVTHTDLYELRELMINRGLMCLARSPEDDPAIVETWL